MTLKEKLGQLIMFGFPDNQPDADTLKLINEYKAGNIILFSHNISSCEQLHELCTNLRELIENACGIPPIISIDQEGGVVARLPKCAVSFPSAMAVFATQNPENAFSAAYYTAQELAALGINCNLAPVMDINTNSQNPVIGVRSYSSDANEVSSYAMQAVNGHLKAGIIPVVKHFPGHGDTNVDSHLGLPCVEKSFNELMSCELVPFIRAINSKVPAIMAAHILFPKIDKENLPASMSKSILTGLLREELGFKGLIMSDCFEMGAIKDNYGTPEGFVAAINAGLDLGCISHSPKLALKALQLAEQAVNNGSLSIQRVDEAVANVANAKKLFAATSAEMSVIGCEKHRAKAQAMMQSAISRLDDNGKLPIADSNAFFMGCPAYRATFASNAADDGNTFAQIMAERFNANFFVYGVKPSNEEIAKAVNLTHIGQTVVIGTYNAHLNQEQLELVRALSQADRKVIAVALRNPYDLPLMPDSVFKLAAFEYTQLSFDAVEHTLRTGKATGRPCI